MTMLRLECPWRCRRLFELVRLPPLAGLAVGWLVGHHAPPQLRRLIPGAPP